MKPRLIVLLLSFFCLFCVVKVSTSQSEYGVYTAYTKSIVEDNDFNIANQMFDDRAHFIVNKSYNYPNHHYAGVSSLWWPAVVFSNSLSKIVGAGPCSISPQTYYVKILCHDVATKDYLSLVGISLFSLMLSIVAIYLCFTYVENHGGHKRGLFFIFCLFLTPIPYYMIMEVGTPVLSGMLVVPLILWLREKESSVRNVFRGGLLISFLGTIHPSVIFYGLFILPLSLGDDRKQTLKHLVYGGLGFSIPFGLNIINNSFKTVGNLDSYFETLSFSSNVLLDFFFSPYRGILFTTPGFFIALMICFLSIKKSTDIRLKKLIYNDEFILVIIILMKCLALSFTYSHGGGVFGARQLIPDFLFLSVIVARRFNLLSFPKLWGGVLFFFILLTFYFSYFFFGVEVEPGASLSYGTDVKFYLDISANRLNSLANYIIYVLSPNEIFYKFFFIPLFLVLIALGYFIIKHLKHFLVIGLVSYFVMTLMNTFVQVKNHKIYEKGYEKNVLIVDDEKTAMFYENFGSLLERLSFLEGQGRDRHIAKQKEKVLSYANEVQELTRKDFSSLIEYYPELKLEPHYHKYNRWIKDSLSYPSAQK